VAGVLRGHFACYAVPGNECTGVFLYQVRDIAGRGFHTSTAPYE
jgi:hypothetical protein